MKTTTWRTPWQGQDIAVYRDDLEVDRFQARRSNPSACIPRLGQSPGDSRTRGRARHRLGSPLFEAHTGFAGRVNFERQDFWAERGCVYWVPPESAAALPPKLRLAEPGPPTLRDARLQPRTARANSMRWSLTGHSRGRRPGPSARTDVSNGRSATPTAPTPEPIDVAPGSSDRHRGQLN